MSVWVVCLIWIGLNAAHYDSLIQQGQRHFHELNLRLEEALLLCKFNACLHQNLQI